MQGWQLVSLHLHKDEVEESHEHIGGILIHEPVPMALCCGITHTVQAELTEKFNQLQALHLPVSDPHYVVPKAEYKALFIEIPDRLIITEEPKWQSKVVQQQDDDNKVWSALLEESNCLLAVKCHRVIISKDPLLIMTQKGDLVEAIPKLAYPTYHLKPSTEYQFFQDHSDLFYIIQCDESLVG